MMMMTKIKRVFWILNTNANSNNGTNYFMRVIDDYCMACCIHFTSSCVPYKLSMVDCKKGRCEKNCFFFKSYTQKIIECIQQFRQKHFNDSLKRIYDCLSNANRLVLKHAECITIASLEIISTD